jgi:hypothetical protein
MTAAAPRQKPMASPIGAFGPGFSGAMAPPAFIERTGALVEEIGAPPRLRATSNRQPSVHLPAVRRGIDHRKPVLIDAHGKRSRVGEKLPLRESPMIAGAAWRQSSTQIDHPKAN